MKTISFVVVLACSTLAAFADVAPAEKPSAKPTEQPSLKGKVYPDEHKTFTTRESGLGVIQLTSDPAEDAHLYFTGDGFVPDEHAVPAH